MQIRGLHTLSGTFIGHGVLTINGRTTPELWGRGQDLTLQIINDLNCGVTASFDSGILVLESEDEITIAGNQDVLDVFGIVASEAQ